MVIITYLEGRWPLQGEGTAGPWTWYFRARHQYWSLSATCNGQDPILVESNTENTFFVGGSYETNPMDPEEAKAIIQRELAPLLVDYTP